jgi:hypothetical protein
MKFRTIPAALALSAFSFAAAAQTGGSMSAPATGGMSSPNHMAAPAGCTGTENHMSGGASNHMAGGSMSGGGTTGGAMASGDHMSGGSMAQGNHMAANNTGCQPAQKPNH